MYTSGSPAVTEPPVTSPTRSEWSYNSNSALRRQRRYERVPPIRATPSSHSQSMPANLSSPLPANTWASGSCSAGSTCTPNVSPSTSARWQRELWSTDTSTDGGAALNDETDVATSPHGSPSSRRAVITATPEQRPAIASRKRSSTSATRAILDGNPHHHEEGAQSERRRAEAAIAAEG